MKVIQPSIGRAGFTLLEVVVAMAIVGLGVVTLLEIFSLGLRLGARSSFDTESMAYGRLVMDEVLARRDIDAGPRPVAATD
jgi:prepilin-type N-terminal cleavage/methylation domain-containing protein